MLLIKKETKNKINKLIKDKSQLFIVGSLILILFGLCLIGFKYCQEAKELSYEEQQVEKFIYDNTSNVKNEKEKTKIEDDGYIAVIQIPKINLKKGIYSKESKLNDVNKNVQVLKESDYPNVQNGNFILAGHSGNSKISYFNNLHKLKKDDLAYVFFSSKEYVYKLVDKYEIDKTGVATIIRNTQKSTMTLITCTTDNKKQVIFIFELMKVGG